MLKVGYEPDKMPTVDHVAHVNPEFTEVHDRVTDGPRGGASTLKRARRFESGIFLYLMFCVSVRVGIRRIRSNSTDRTVTTED